MDCRLIGGLIGPNGRNFAVGGIHHVGILSIYTSTVWIHAAVLSHYWALRREQEWLIQQDVSVCKVDRDSFAAMGQQHVECNQQYQGRRLVQSSW